MGIQWLESVYGSAKPIVAMCHLDALPGDPSYDKAKGMGYVIDRAYENLRALQDGGVDAVMFSNEFSLPYERQMNFVTPAAMAYVVGRLKQDLRVPFGVDCISDGRATIELAAAVDADFVRGTFSGVYVGDGGLYNNDFSKLMRRRAELYLQQLRMLYFINPESDQNLDNRPLADIARSTIFKVHPDGLCVSANAAGQDVDEELIASVKQAAPQTVILCNTGCRPDTIARKLAVADGAVVGTYFKEGGRLENEQLENVRVCADRVRELMQVVYQVRAR